MLKPYPTGIYSLIGNASIGSPIPSQPQLDQPFIDGIRIRGDWAEAEPSPGVYNWTNLDNALAMVRAKGKKCGIFINGGSGSPDWLFAQPYNAAPYILIDTGNDAGKRIPIPGDPVYLQRWTSFIAALGSRYDSNPDVLYIPMGGIGHAGEWIIAGGTQDAANLGTPSGVDKWKAQSKAIIDAYRAAFPSTRIHGMLAKPFGNDLGDPAMVEIADYAESKCGQQFAIGFAAVNPVSQNNQQARTVYIRSHWTTLPTLGQFVAAGPGMPQGIPLSESVDQALRAGNALHLRAVEVYRPDALNTAVYNYTAPAGAMWDGSSVAGTPAGLVPRRNDLLQIDGVLEVINLTGTASRTKTVTINWTGALSTNVDIYKDNVLLETVPNTGTRQYVLTGAEVDATHTYEVRATSASNDVIL